MPMQAKCSNHIPYKWKKKKDKYLNGGRETLTENAMSLGNLASLAMVNQGPLYMRFGESI